jgi:hypothetical protein
MRTRLTLLMAALSFALAAPAVAQQSASMPLAKELGTLLDQKELDSVAARNSRRTNTRNALTRPIPATQRCLRRCWRS